MCVYGWVGDVSTVTNEMKQDKEDIRCPKTGQAWDGSCGLVNNCIVGRRIQWDLWLIA